MHDYIVVGAGSAGCVIASRLSDRGAKVLVLEAGGPADSPLIRIPAAYSLLSDTHMDWAYRTVAQSHLNGRRIFWPRGRVLGGSSSINYMVYIRGNRGDYDHWRQLGNIGWSYEDVLPYFVRAERNERLKDVYHGCNGPVAVRDNPNRKLGDMFIAAAIEQGLQPTEDFNGAEQDGCGILQYTVDDRGRCSSAAAYLRNEIEFGNPVIATNALALRVLIDKGRAIGVRYLSLRGVESAHASAEVILCGGAINSPQLLLLSGIGPADELRAAGIEPVHNLPGVGKNLQDHLACLLRCAINSPLTLYGLSRDEWLAAQTQFLEQGTGPCATNLFEAGAFVRCDPTSTFPDVQILCVSSFAGELDGAPPDRHGVTLAHYVARPRSRGQIQLRSANPLDKPAIDPQYLSDPEDLRLTLLGLRLNRRITKSGALSSIVKEEVWPGPNATSDADLAAYVRRSATTAFHPVGTCKMGSDSMAVVDSSLRVHGLQGLRVADASIMPTLVSGNTNAPTIMIGEKASDLILATREINNPLERTRSESTLDRNLETPMLHCTRHI
jgi:choline dehydrogenase